MGPSLCIHYDALNENKCFNGLPAKVDQIATFQFQNPFWAKIESSNAISVISGRLIRVEPLIESQL